MNERTSPSGAELAHTYFQHVVEPLLASEFPGLPVSAGRLGTGSDVLGLDDEMSRDHDWGLAEEMPVMGRAGDASDDVGSRMIAARLAQITVHLAFLLERRWPRQNAAGLTSCDPAVVPFWERPHLHPDPRIVAQLTSAIVDPAVRALRQGLGSAEQQTDNVAVLTDARRRRALVALA